jgi:N-acetylglutamate synthase-like GNAT family acetyltransferase
VAEPFPVTLRSAAAADRETIVALVRGAHLNPFDLRWPNFLVAEQAGRIAGVVQVRPLKGGVRELASLAVVEELRGTGVGSTLVRAVLAREPGVLYLFCRSELTGFYERFGFTELSGSLPRALAGRHRVAGAMSRLARLFGGGDLRVAVMRREPGAPG